MNSQTLPRNFNRKKFNILKIKIRKSNSPLNLRLPRSRDAIRLLFHIAKFYFIHSPDYSDILLPGKRVRENTNGFRGWTTMVEDDR